jgi:hypothetical protein
MKKVYLVLLGLIMFAEATAKTVDVSLARAIGYAFLSRNTDIVLPNGADDLHTTYTSTALLNGVSKPCYYVFNTTNGFVMISADDNVMPILAYSTEAAFGTVNIPSQVQWWMDGYTKQISYVIANNLPGAAKIAAQWKDLSTAGITHNLAKTTDVTPLVHTTWDQLPVYNALCPGAGTSQSVTGCVATAMAQVLKFWNWPSVGAGAHTYTNNIYGTQTANFGATTYSFAAMPSSISALSSVNAKTNIATLMYHCGVSVDMGYNTAAAGGSGAWVELHWSFSNSPSICAENALKTYFKYKNTLHGDLRSSYSSDADWQNALTTDLDAGRPVIYTGDGSDGGHCWVADGYKTTSTIMIHFNWGWSGQSNGYFTVNNLAPPALGAGGGNGNFNNNQAAIFGIEPNKAITANTNTLQLDTAINMAYSPQTYQQPLTFTTSILNNTGAPFTGSVTAQVFDHNGKLVTTLPSVSVANIANTGNSGVLTFTASTQNLFTMVPDIYSIRIYAQPAGGNWTAVGDNGGFLNYASLEIVNDGGVQLMDSLQGTLTGHILKNGVPVNITAYLGTVDYSTYNGTLDAALYDPATQNLVFDIQKLPNSTVGGNGSAYTFTSTAKLNVAPGTYILAVGGIDGNNQFKTFGSTYFQNPMLVSVPYKTGVNTIVGQNDVKLYPNPATGIVYVDLNNINATTINVLDIQGRIIEHVVPAAHAITAINVQNFAPGVYMVQIHTDSDVITKKISVIK